MTTARRQGIEGKGVIYSKTQQVAPLEPTETYAQDEFLFPPSARMRKIRGITYLARVHPILLCTNMRSRVRVRRIMRSLMLHMILTDSFNRIARECIGVREVRVQARVEGDGARLRAPRRVVAHRRRLVVRVGFHFGSDGGAVVECHKERV